MINNKKVNILGCPFDSLSFDEAVKWVEELIDSHNKGYICTVNVSILMMMRSDQCLDHIVKNASLIVADGQPLIWASKLNSDSLQERITGLDLMYALCEIASSKGYRVSFIGSTKETLQKAITILKDRYPNLIITRNSDGYFSEQEELTRVEAVNAEHPQIVFVAMGAPKQEIFIDKYLSKMNVNMMLTIGGALEIVTGNLKRAPIWMQKAGLEWLYRFVQEPGRLWKRYLYTNFLFIILMINQIFKHLFTKIRDLCQKN